MHYIPELLAQDTAARLRAVFAEAGYTEPALARLYGLPQLAEFELNRLNRPDRPEPATACEALASLFLDGSWVALSLARRLLSRQALETLHEAELLFAEDERICARIHVYPVAGMLIASDRWSNPDGSPSEAKGDLVYPALNINTQRFLELLPLSPCDSFLDIGAGTGVATLLAARHGAREACALDILPGCTRFAGFNAVLNDLTGITAVTSDGYQAIQGRTFDRIVSHPPYVPSIMRRWVFYSGGEDGEMITRSVVEGLPRHLRPGGIGFVLTLGSDRTEDAFEHRVRGWLGEAQDEFDVAFLIRATVTPESFASRVTGNEVRPQAEFMAFKELFQRLKVESLCRGLLILQRHDTRRPAFTVRRNTSQEFNREQWEWLIRWETAALSDRKHDLLLDTPLHMGITDVFEVHHKFEAGAWIPASYILRGSSPYPVNCSAHPWMANLIALCDGKTTGREHLAQLKEVGLVGEDTSPEEFARALAGLVSGGFVEVEGFRPPRAKE